QGVVKAGVRAAGVNEVRRAQLLDAPQPLHFAAVEDARLFLREFDVAVYRIADDHPSSSFALDPLMLAHATPWLFPRFSPDDNPGTGLRVRVFRADADARRGPALRVHFDLEIRAMLHVALLALCCPASQEEDQHEENDDGLHATPSFGVRR